MCHIQLNMELLNIAAMHTRTCMCGALFDLRAAPRPAPRRFYSLSASLHS